MKLKIKSEYIKLVGFKFRRMTSKYPDKKKFRERSPSSASEADSDRPPPPKKLASTTATSESENDTAKYIKPISTKLASKPGNTSESNLNAFSKMMVAKAVEISSLVKEIDEKRLRLFNSIEEFRFNKKRVRILSESCEIPTGSKAILYWMSREQRVQG